jgi:acetylornithine deacetylase/succinyl-diaminopimelate desuccinylase-like protein
MLDPAVAAYLEEHKDDHLSGLLELLAFPSVANVRADAAGNDACLDCARWLQSRFEKLGFSAKLLEARGKPNLLAWSSVRSDLPTVLIYGHYDVQPPDPLELWDSEPFSPEVRDGAIFARGANDNKGQFWAHFCALKAWLGARGELPVNVKFFLEGEEEIGSPHLESFLSEHRDLLRADACLVSDSEFFAADLPSITYSLRGIACYEIRLRGPQADVHSGIHGGAVTNPATALCRLVGGLHDGAGRVTLEGFYDRVIELTDDEKRRWAQLPFDAEAYRRDLGVDALGGGEDALGVLERRWGRPALDVNGLAGGYGGQGSKTIIPAEAVAKVSVRMVPDQDPDEIFASLREYVAANTPGGCRSSVVAQGAGRAVRLAKDSPAMQAGIEAMTEAFGRAPALIGCGASVPITELFQRILGLDAVMLGYGLPDDRIHSPNERFRLEQLWGGARATASFLERIARL